MADLNNSLEVKPDHPQQTFAKDTQQYTQQDRNFTSSSQRNILDQKQNRLSGHMVNQSDNGNNDFILPEISSKNGGSLSIQELAVQDQKQRYHSNSLIGAGNQVINGKSGFKGAGNGTLSKSQSKSKIGSTIEVNGGMGMLANTASNLNLFNAQKTRQKMEKDAQLLANRIALLKQEEMRTWRKIEETKKRTTDILVLKQKNFERLSQHNQQNINEENSLKGNQQLTYEVAKKRQEDRKKLETDIYMMKREQAIKIKKLTKKNEKKRDKFLSRVQSENQLRGQIIKQSEQYARLKREAQERKHMNEIKEFYDTRVHKEEKVITKKERELLQMEMLEMELIKNLQGTQNLQKTAYGDLEKALMMQTVKTGDDSLAQQFQLGDYLTSQQADQVAKKKKKRRAQSQVKKDFEL
eukprot:403344286